MIVAYTHESRPITLAGSVTASRLGTVHIRFANSMPVCLIGVVVFAQYGPPVHARRLKLATSETTKRTIATQKRMRAPSTAVPATPPKPKKAATIATTKNTIA